MKDLHWWCGMMDMRVNERFALVVWMKDVHWWCG
jgi:hypothetical protein